MTLYFANPSTEPIRDAMRAGKLGAITTPRSRQTPPAGVPWIADNALGPGRNGKPAEQRPDEAWYRWLESRPWDRSLCRFAVAPDVVGDAAATIARSAPWLPRIRALGIPAAFVAQDGLEDLDVPWDSFDVLFIGGSTEWKLGPAVRVLAQQAAARGKPVHVGRVNSGKRYRYSRDELGAASADGTFVAFAPTENLQRLAAWAGAPPDPRLEV